MRASLGVHISLCSVLSCISLQLAAQDAHAPMRSAARAPAAVSSDASISAEQLLAMQDKLDKGDASAVEQALMVLAQMGGDAAAQSVVARLRRGLPPQLTEVAIDALVMLERPLAAPALLELALHRRVPVRVKAIAALGALRVKSAQSALLYALDDPSAEVRSAAVEALASAGNPRALPALFAAADHGVVGAWKAIGSLATPADLKRILERAAGGDVSVLRPALDALSARKDLPLDAKLRTVAELEKLASPSARACLAQWLAALQNDAPPRMRQVLLVSIKKLDHAQQPPAAGANTAVAKLKPGKPARSSGGPLAEAPTANRETAP
jgi:hypothetical protein